MSSIQNQLHLPKLQRQIGLQEHANYPNSPKNQSTNKDTKKNSANLRKSLDFLLKNMQRKLRPYRGKVTRQNRTPQEQHQSTI